jgi:hypothetical protein
LQETGDAMSIGLGPHLRLVALGTIAHWCPACDIAHQVHLFASTSPDHRKAQWDHHTDKPTFTPDLRWVQDGSNCHYRITGGRVEFLPDCSHIFAGRTVPLPVYPARRA